MPGTIAARYYELVKLSAEYIMLPLHYMALHHMYSVASAIGAVVLVAYVALSVTHARAQHQTHGLQ